MPRKPLPVPMKHCKHCGAILTRKRFNGRLEDRSAFMRRKYCDRKCMAAAMEGKIKVLNARNSRKQATKTRSKSCAHCGSGSRLQVHHRDGNPLNNEPSNLVTLCASCHMRLHWQDWKKTKYPQRHCLHCDKPARHRGLCNTHWTRYRKYGNPLLRRERRNGEWVWFMDASKSDQLIL